MKCPKCDAPKLIQESLSPDGKTKKVRCEACGFTEVRDQQDRRLLTEVPAAPVSPLLG